MVEVNNGMFTTYQLVQDFFHPYVFCKRVYGVRLKPHILGPYQIILSPPVQLFLVHSNPNIFCINKPFFINFLFLAPHKSEFLASEIPSYPLPPKKKDSPPAFISPTSVWFFDKFQRLLVEAPCLFIIRSNHNNCWFSQPFLLVPILIHLATTLVFPHHFPCYPQSFYCLKMVD